jgi:hypothetical protein
MAFKSRNQMMMEQHYEDERETGIVTTAAWEIYDEYGEDGLDILIDTFEGHDIDEQTIKDIWADVCLGAAL